MWATDFMAGLPGGKSNQADCATSVRQFTAYRNNAAQTRAAKAGHKLMKRGMQNKVAIFAFSYEIARVVTTAEF